MSLRTILHFPDPRLRLKALPVTDFDDDLRILVDDMFETMYNGYGCGLAATQINVQQRVIVIDLIGDKTQQYCFINPEILTREGKEESDEGCLSVPGIWEPVQRAERIKFRAQNMQGNVIEMDADGLLAVCVQHETDHLDGKLFVDYLSPLKRQRIQKKLEKQRKQTL